jgi:hypothetical protein
MVALLPHERVFVIRLSPDADPSRGHLSGRVEHVDSGRSVQFASNIDLNEFLARILCEEEAPQRGSTTGGRPK